jgi:uncharacterized iron-regulated membrane protein
MFGREHHERPSDPGPGLWQRWLRQPKKLLVRRAIFQMHLWMGIAIGLYVVVVCVSGSALVFRPELSRYFSRGPLIVAGSGTPLSDEQLTEIALRQNPEYKLRNLWRNKDPQAAIEVWLDGKSGGLRQRLLDPFTGADLGHAVPLGSRAVQFLLDLHDNLLAGRTGRVVNGLGGFVLTLLSLTGLVVWWPGIGSWRRSLSVHRGVGWKRFTWDLHSMIGFWTFALIFMWALTGFYLVFQESFAPLVDYIEPLNEETFEPRRIDAVLVSLGRAHFGRVRGWPRDVTLGIKYLWVILGLAPAILAVTGGLMWWTRVIRKSGSARRA